MGALEDDLDAGVRDQRLALENMEKVVLPEVMEELYTATRLFGPFNSEHEGYAIIKEELDELWDEVKKKKPRTRRDLKKMRKEAIQVAAMAVRFVHDLTEDA